MSKEQTLSDLKSRIRHLEGRRSNEAGSVHFGITALDDALGRAGLPLACLHEVYGDDVGTAPAAGFVAACLTLLRRGPIVWIATNDALYLPGLKPFGITAADLLFVTIKNAKDGLWAMEEALRWPGLCAVVAEIDRFDLTATRRLQLAAEDSGVTGFILARREQGLSSGVTRWQVSSAPAPDAETVAWHVNLLRCRGGRTASSTVFWCKKFVPQNHESASLQRTVQ